MHRRIYEIHMHTPLGDRAGTMEIQFRENTICGYLDVLKHTEPFEGTIDENGQCTIQGTLVTLMNSVPYTANGQITSDWLRLLLKGGRNRFPVTGTVFQEKQIAESAEQEGRMNSDDGTTR